MQTETTAPEEISKPHISNCFFNITVTETVAVAVIIIAIIIVKYFFTDTFSDLRKLYRQKLFEDTGISEVLEPERIENADEI